MPPTPSFFSIGPKPRRKRKARPGTVSSGTGTGSQTGPAKSPPHKRGKRSTGYQTVTYVRKIPRRGPAKKKQKCHKW